MSKESDQLLMLTSDQINYGVLARETLAELAQESDPFIAQSALTELWHRKGSEVVEIAWKILSQPIQERHLQSKALKVLFDLDRENALDYMEEHVHRVDPYLLNVMAELILYNTDFRYEFSVAQKIIQRTKGNSSNAIATSIAECKELERILVG